MEIYTTLQCCGQMIIHSANEHDHVACTSTKPLSNYNNFASNIYICCDGCCWTMCPYRSVEMKFLKKLLTSVSRVSKQKDRPTLTHCDTLLYIECSFFYTLVQFGISLVLSQVFPTPPNGKKKEKNQNHYSWCRDFK